MRSKLLYFFWFLSGEDYLLIAKSTEYVKRQFAVIGIIVFFISGLTLGSIICLIRHIFYDTSLFITLVVGGLWCFLISNLYVFLLYTISPTLLPVSRNARRRLKKGDVQLTENFIYSPTAISRTISLLFRVFMILLLAIFLSIPLNMEILIPYFTSDEYMGLIKSQFIRLPEAFLLTVFWCIIFLVPILLKYKIRRNSVLEKDFETSGSSKWDLMYIRDNLISPIDFTVLFLKIRKVNISTFKTSDFYFYKSLVEYKFILDEYDDFLRLHDSLLNHSINEANKKILNIERVSSDLAYDQKIRDLLNYKIEKYEYFDDAPFRTTPKVDATHYESEEEFLKMFYNK